MKKITIPADLYEQVRLTAQKAGYSSADEFVVHLLEHAVARSGGLAEDEDVLERLRGLGYIS
jgi:predicted CopG family antitoxin